MFSTLRSRIVLFQKVVQIIGTVLLGTQLSTYVYAFLGSGHYREGVRDQLR